MGRHQQVDLRVPDPVALDEIELYSEVLSAVATAEGPLTTAQIDRALGVIPRDGSTGTPAAGRS